MQLPFAYIDLYKALSDKDIIDVILDGVGALLGTMEPTAEKLLKTAGKFFSEIHIGVSAKGYGLSVKWDRSTQSSIHILINTLEKLDAYAKKQKRRVVMVMDEFQSVYHVMRSNYAIEAAIREVAQKSSHVVYVFSGSTRHILDGMFHDKARPFYRLCDVIYLDRIKTESYVPYINKAAKARWHSTLSKSVMEAILLATENYPYYVNKLCHLLWQADAAPTVEQVEISWRQFAYESKMAIDRYIDELSLNQKRILVHLAQHPIHQPSSSKNARSWGMNGASIHQALKVLLEKDYVYQRVDECYDILDPLVKTVLRGE